MKKSKQSKKSPTNQSQTVPAAGSGMLKIRPLVAGIDLGSISHFVCAPTGDGCTEVRVFGTTTSQLAEIATWLTHLKIESIALESTGVYWIPLFEILDSHGFEVILTDTRQLSRVPGRKTDFQDCQWLQQLHSCGLLQGCFRPDDTICQLRSLSRAKATLVAERSDWLRRMQKCLDQMNVRIHRAVSDIDGATGMAILRAIVEGERDPAKLAKFRDPRCQNSQETIAQELTGNWRRDHLFNLEQALKMYDVIQERIADYEITLRCYMQQARCERADLTPLAPVKNKAKAKSIKKRGQEPMRQALHAVTGVDLTTIDGIGVETAEVAISEYGGDLKQFERENQFVKHLRMAPNQNITGGKPIRKGKVGKSATRTGQALRMAATTLRHSQSALGAYYRRIAATKGCDVAVFATARKLATYIYRMLRWGQTYVDEGAAVYEQRYQTVRISRMQIVANQLGFQLVPQKPVA